MSLTGSWNMTMKSPIGEQKAQLELTESGSSLTGTMGSGADSNAIQEGSVDGQVVSWSVKITKPMPLTLAFSGTAEAGTITGEVKFGGFGAGPFTAVRA
jgi:hypothetical protein